MTCKDCIHYDVCEVWNYNIPSEYKGIESKCECFKEKSKFVELPCNVGDTVYTIIKCEEPFVDEGYVNSICYDKGEKVEIYVRYDCGLTYWYWVKDIGKRFFFSKEEAERALKERESK